MTLSGHSLEQQIERVAEPLARALEVDLVEIRCLGKGAGSYIRITIDKPGGVGIQDCEGLHQSLSRALDALGPLPHSHRLEVSSPGLDRPLKHRRDYQRVLDKLVRIQFFNDAKQKTSIVGHLHALSDDGVEILPLSPKKRQQPSVSIAWQEIVKARLEVEF